MKAGSYCLACHALDCEAHAGRQQNPDLPHFWPRQVDVLRALLDPRFASAKEIAYALGITHGSIKIYIVKIYDALGWKMQSRSLARLTLWVMIHAETLGVSLPTAAAFDEDLAA